MVNIFSLITEGATTFFLAICVRYFNIRGLVYDFFDENQWEPRFWQRAGKLVILMGE
jgi:hypothetical protein